ncbi:unnamed protein product [Rhodiola kirilowii]
MATLAPRRVLIKLFMTMLLICNVTSMRGGDLTKGFVSMPLDQTNLVIQKPYDVGVAERSSFKNGVHTLWVYSTDKPHTRDSHTNPRTEIRITGYDYSSGVWQFEAFGYVPSNTSGVVVMQIFGAGDHATTMMLRVHDGALSYYRNPVLVENIYDEWFKLNVIHDVGGSTVKIYINSELKYEASGRQGSTHYFKCGVYAQDDDSDYMESQWKQIKVLKKEN